MRTTGGFTDQYILDPKGANKEKSIRRTAYFLNKSEQNTITLTTSKHSILLCCSTVEWTKADLTKHWTSHQLKLKPDSFTPNCNNVALGKCVKKKKKRKKPGMGSWGGRRRGLGPRNDVLTTCKAVTQHGGQQIIAVFIFRLFRSKKRTGRGNQKCLKNWKNNIMHLCFSCISYLSFGTEIAGETKTQPC